MQRREFLQPQSLSHAVGSLDWAEPACQPSHGSDGCALVRCSRRAMATRFEIVLPHGTPHALAAASAALDEIDRIESLLSAYRADSEISRINQRASHEEVETSAEVFALLERAVLLNRLTEGAFDIAAGALVKAWGFYRGPRRVPSVSELSQAMQRTGTRYVQLEPARRGVRFTRVGVELNLGSIGKGYALDRAADVLRQEYGVRSALLHGGHSSVYAIGSGPEDEQGWPVGVMHPWAPSRRLAIVHLKDRGLGTSAATFQHLEWHGRKLGHVLDPRRGWPADGMASATVLAASAAEADALSTGLFVLGESAAARLAEQREDLCMIFLPEGSKATTTVVSR